MKHFIYFDKSDQVAEQYKQNIKWLKKLKTAITFDNIIPYFQPIINNKTGKTEKYECLMRLKSEDNKAISPYFYLDVAKKSKIYPHLTKTMVLKSFEMFKDKDIMFSINLSIIDIQDPDTMDFIFSLLKDYKIADVVSILGSIDIVLGETDR